MLANVFLPHLLTPRSIVQNRRLACILSVKRLINSLAFQAILYRYN